ncbi:MAG: hypothetical protein E6H97_02185 [Chloroflexi bacterium]|nr:MAG: hypothetical protein E6H97_02185 [Chloroflexota bacterium]
MIRVLVDGSVLIVVLLEAVVGSVVVVADAAGHGQTATPSRLQRPSTLFRHARRWPAAATHAAISSWHARRHCRTMAEACADVATWSVARSVSSDANLRVFGCCRISQAPRASSRRAPGQSVGGDHV